MASKLRPGTPTPKSGQYDVIKPNGRPSGLEITAVKNKPLPPTEAGGGFKLADPTKHKK